MPEKLLLTGASTFPFDLKDYVEKNLGAAVIAPFDSSELFAFAIPIGLALEGMANTSTPVEFRQAELASPRKLKKLNRLYIYYLSICATLTVALLTAGHLIIGQQESSLKQKLASFTLAKNASFENLNDGIAQCEEALSKEKIPFPIVSTAPRVSDVLAWLCAHPLLSEEIDMKEVHYDLAKYPKLTGAREPYLAKVELKFTASTPAAARLFREALLKGDDLVNPKPEVTWSVEQNMYRASFYLKSVKR